MEQRALKKVRSLIRATICTVLESRTDYYYVRDKQRGNLSPVTLIGGLSFVIFEIPRMIIDVFKIRIGLFVFDDRAFLT